MIKVKKQLQSHIKLRIEVHLVMRKMAIRKYQSEDFDQLAKVMDEGRKQELQTEGLAEAFVALKDAPYLNYFLSCDIYIAEVDKRIVGFIGLRKSRLEFIYVMPGMQGQGIGTALMEKALTKLPRPVKLAVFSENEKAKRLYEKFGFKVIETRTEKWSDNVPVFFSEDTMELM